MIAIIRAWIASKLRLIEYIALAAILALAAYGGYHTRVILDEAAANRHSDNLVAAAPKIIHDTQVITKVIHDAKDPCTDAAVPAAVAAELRR